MLSGIRSPADRRRSLILDILCVVLVFVAFALLIGRRMPYADWKISPNVDTPGQNVALAEALAWRDGRLTLSENFYEDADFKGHTYNVVGLAFTIISFVVSSIADALGCSSHFPRLPFYLLMILPVPIVGYFAIRRTVTTPLWATLLTIGFLCGTPMGPEIAHSRGGNIYEIDHVLAVTGIFVFAADLLGRRRIWPAALGLILACWSRQITCLYALPLLYFAWQKGRPLANAIGESTSDKCDVESRASSRFRYRPLVIALSAVAVAGIVPMTLSYLKFGNPFDSGYLYLYPPSRTDPIALRARDALFSIKYIPLHIWAMDLDFPHWCIRQGKLHIDLINTPGGSLWLTTPLTLAIFGTVRRWWRDLPRRVLMLGTIPVLVGLYCYHTIGVSYGMYRYALDFLPVWWLVIAPYTETSRSARRLTIVAVAYSILYYYVLHW